MATQIDETKDVIKAAVGLTAVIIEAGGDGFQVTDIAELLGEREDIVEAIQGAGEIEGELRDLTLEEILDLADFTSAQIRENFLSEAE